MARPQLTALLEPRGNQQETTRVLTAATPDEPENSGSRTAPAQSPEHEATPAPERATKATQRSRKRHSDPAPPAPKQSANDALPPYLQFERKEARLRDDQLTSLNVRARQLNKTKDRDADRITDNTLIRVAVDLLLARADELAGGDEAALRKSLGI